MKILALADLHNYKPWFQWVKLNPQDLTLIAGDMLDGLAEKGLPSQVLFTKAWFDSFQKPLGVCSGNHDSNTGGLHDDPSAVDLLLPEEKTFLSSIMYDSKWKRRNNWMDCLEKKNTVTDIRTEVLTVNSEKIVITTLPYLFHDQSDPYSIKLWKEGKRKKEEFGCPWIVLHHDPAYGTSGDGALYGNNILHQKLIENKPDFLFSGHLHSQPYGGCFADKVGVTWCLNPGHPHDEMFGETELPITPNHIFVDTEEMTAVWNASFFLNGKWTRNSETIDLSV